MLFYNNVMKKHHRNSYLTILVRTLLSFLSVPMWDMMWG